MGSGMTAERAIAGQVAGHGSCLPDSGLADVMGRIRERPVEIM
jgi:hypothetical protein